MFESALQSQQMLIGLLLASLLGVFGQGARVVAGLKKQADDSASAGKQLADDFNWTRFVLSLFIGAIAGGLAFMGYWFGGDEPGADPSKAPVLFGVMAAGYAGADFIEATFKKWLPGSKPAHSKPAED